MSQGDVAQLANRLAEEATGMPAYLVDEETYAGWEAEAEQRLRNAPPPEKRSELQEAIRKARGDEPTGEEIEQSIGFLNAVSKAMRKAAPNE